MPIGNLHGDVLRRLDELGLDRCTEIYFGPCNGAETSDIVNVYAVVEETSVHVP
jgi:hypothetical protein